jgi:hypothetical protein
MRVDFVMDLTGDPGGTGPGNYDTASRRDHVFDAHYVVNGASCLLTQSSGSTVRFTAFDDSDLNGSVVGVISGVANDVSKDSITAIAISYTGAGGSTSSGLISSSGIYTVAGIAYTVTFVSSGPDAGTVLVAGIQGPSGNSQGQGTQVALFTEDGYNSFEVLSVGGSTFKVGDFKAAVPSSQPVQLSIPVVVVDGDGDQSAVSNLAITVNPTPVVLDLGAVGIHYLDLSFGIQFDYGSLTSSVWQTAWVGPEDAILAYDYDGSHTVSSGHEIVLTAWSPGSETDLAALRDHFDSNHDLVFDSRDTAWDSFGAWSDHNSDGICQIGEYSSLEQLGIVSLDLHALSSGPVVMNGDVAIYGHSSFAYSDGSIGAVDDVAFGVLPVEPVSQVIPVDSSGHVAPIDLHDLVSSYLTTLVQVQDSNGDGLYDGSQNPGELAYHLDAQITDYLDAHGMSDAAYAAIHQDVMDHIALNLNDVIPGTDHDLAFNDQGHVTDDAAVLVALDQHFQDLLDHHNSIDDSVYHDVVVSDHTSV